MNKYIVKTISVYCICMFAAVVLQVNNHHHAGLKMHEDCNICLFSMNQSAIINSDNNLTINGYYAEYCVLLYDFIFKSDQYDFSHYPNAPPLQSSLT
jgi:hypothetical protein